MNKIANEKIAQVLRDAGAALLSVTAERDAAQEKIAALEQERKCEKLASAMHAKNLERDFDHAELTARLQKEAEAGKLEEITRAVDLVGPNMSFAKTAQYHDNPGGGSDRFTNYILGRVD